MRLITAAVKKLPVVTVLIAVDAGSSNDPLGKEGIASLTAALLAEGTEQYDGAELAEKFEELGTSVETGADWDSAFLKITTLSQNLQPALALLGQVITQPQFAEREIERLKAERLAEILQLETEPRGLADEKFSEFVYADQSRYSQPDEGSESSVKALTRKDVKEFYHSNYTSSVSTVLLAGDITAHASRRVVSDVLKNLRKGHVNHSPVTTNPRSRTRRIQLVHKIDAPQSELRVGHVGLPRLHPDFFPTLVMNAILGGLFGSRINLNLREVHGYTYGASSYYDWRRGAGPFVVSTAVQSDVTQAAIREILLEIDRIRAELVSDAELSLAKDYLDGVFPIRYETTSAIASALANRVIYGLPADYYDSYRENIRRVTSSDVLRAAQSHIHPEQLQIVVVGDAKALTGPLAELEFGPLQVHDGR
ncbi:MAG: M16 family metallopeptidase [Gemmatimonadaceae bacterium]